MCHSTHLLDRGCTNANTMRRAAFFRDILKQKVGRVFSKGYFKMEARPFRLKVASCFNVPLQ